MALGRLNEEFHRRVKTQGSFLTEDAAMVLLYGLVATGRRWAGSTRHGLHSPIDQPIIAR